jgi:hypothetical protein
MSRFIKYPTGRLYAVLDDPAAGGPAVEALVRLGVEPAAIEILRGDSAAAAFDGTGAHHGRLARLRRTVEFTLMDQMPDFAWYEAAIRDGRTVIAVRATNEAQRRRIVAALLDLGAHFVNYFGRFATEEHARWRGSEPAVPNLLRR